MSVEKLKEYAKMVNVAHELDAETLDAIGRQVIEGYQEDLTSMQEWLDDVKKIEELAQLKSVKKSWPLPNSSNVKLPIITKACFEYQSRTYPVLFKDSKLVKYAILGSDDIDPTGGPGKKEKQGKKVADFMNYQLLYQSKNWEKEQRNLLFQQALIGFICKKQYYDPIKNRIISRLCDYKKLIMNSDICSLEDAPRITEEIPMRLSAIVARKNKKVDDKSVFLKEPVEELYELFKIDTLNKEIPFLEQQTYLDLDDDGIQEPYIVTVLKDTGKVFRIQARFHEEGIEAEDGDVIHICPIDIYTDYHFLTNPMGKFQSVGFGILLLHLTQASNSVLNQLIDAGTLANMKGGYMDARLKVIPTGNSYHETGEFKLVKCLPGGSLKEGIVPTPYGEPSHVLFQLLGLLIQHAKDLSSSTEIMSGTQNSQNAKTGATLALLQQGRSLHDSIQKGTYSSMDTEFKQIFKLNSIHLDESQFIEYVGGGINIRRDDFDIKKVHVMPIADPNLASDQEKLTQAQFVQSMQQSPGVDPVKATKFILASTGIPNIESILADPNQKPPPNPDLLKIQADMEEAGQKLNIEGEKLKLAEQAQIIEVHYKEAQIALIHSQIQNTNAQAMLAEAQANAVPQKLKLDDLALQLDGITAKMDAQMQLIQMRHDKELQTMNLIGQAASQGAQQGHQLNMQQNDIQAQQDMQAQQADVGGDNGAGQGSDDQTPSS